MPSMEESLAMEAAAEKGCMESHAMYRRCVTDTDFKTIHGVTTQAAPDLLQLFNIFQVQFIVCSFSFFSVARLRKSTQ